MNGPFEISEETQVAMAKYNAQVIDMVADLFVRPGMPQPRRDPATSDEDRDGEYRAQEIFYAALARFRSEVKIRTGGNRDNRGSGEETKIRKDIDGWLGREEIEQEVAKGAERERERKMNSRIRSRRSHSQITVRASCSSFPSVQKNRLPCSATSATSCSKKLSALMLLIAL